MADVRHRTTAGNWFRYLLRFVGLLALIVGAFGLVFYFSSHGIPVRFEALQRRVTDTGGIDGVMLIVGLVGTLLAAAWLLAEAVMGLTLVTGKRAAVGGNVYAQIALAALLFAVVNAFAFKYYARYDLTRDAQFSLNPELTNELRTLSNESPTDVVVLQLHKSAIAKGRDPDNIDKAAELKVVEKVNDLVDQLRELGPRFRVTVLDRQDEYYADKVEKFPEELRKAVNGAPEDSIFFYANNRVRRMSFSDFYRTDKSASRLKEKVKVETAEGVKEEERIRSTNLVLLPQGKEEFVRRLLALEQRKPRIGLLTIHPLLSGSGKAREEYTSTGLRKSLEANGFDVQDVLIKRFDTGGPVPAAQSFDETRLDTLEAQVEFYSEQMAERESVLKFLQEALPLAKTLPLTELQKKFKGLVKGTISTEEHRRQIVESIESETKRYDAELADYRARLAKVDPEYQKLMTNEQVNEGRRSSDSVAKLKQAIAGCDLLFIPRLTAVELADGHVVPPELYTMPKDQVEVIRDFIKSGKPVLACFGANKFGNQGDVEADDLERLFTSLGFVFGNQTIVTDDEVKSTGRSANSNAALENPPETPLLKLETEEKNLHPIRGAFLVSARSVDGALELRRSGPRPIGISEKAKAGTKHGSVIVETIAQSWNEEKPVASRGYNPRYDATKPDDAKKGTPDEERRGPFNVGAALETKLPGEWFDDVTDTVGAAGGGLAVGVKEKKAVPTVRLVVFGHGGLFVGKDLNPAQEQLLLHTVNWQLGRDELLPKDAPPEKRWQFPRVEMSEQQKKLWHMGTFLGLPMLCAFMGVVVLMTRKMR